MQVPQEFLSAAGPVSLMDLTCFHDVGGLNVAIWCRKKLAGRRKVRSCKMMWLSGSNSVVECDLAKVEVAGSNPVSRSIFQRSPAEEGSRMTAPSFALPSLIVGVLLVVLTGCGSDRSLQSVAVSPATASSTAQFTATGTYNQTPMSADITASATWCVGSSNGHCAGNIAVGASVNAGMAQCLAGFTGPVTILAGKAGTSAGPDMGVQLKPFGVAQLNCP